MEGELAAAIEMPVISDGVLTWQGKEWVEAEHHRNVERLGVEALERLRQSEDFHARRTGQHFDQMNSVLSDLRALREELQRSQADLEGARATYRAEHEVVMSVWAALGIEDAATAHGMTLSQAVAVWGRRPRKMAINDLFDKNVSRCLKWHPGGIEEWSALEWAGAMAGEAGEAANAAKKLKRVESHLQNINAPGRALIDVDSARSCVAQEVADTILYGLLLMKRVGVDSPEDVIRDVFNKKSEEYGFPERV
jgi:NTP pyrophosphatase (non-canonical NTP hydrolase)